MYGYKLRIFVWSSLAIFVAGYLTFFGDKPSWSQNAETALWFLLNVVLISIAESFSQIAAHSLDRNVEIYKWFSIPVRLEHLARFTQYAFYSVLVFHLDSEILPEWMHMVATGIAVTGLYLMVVGWFPMWSRSWWLFVVSVSVSALALILAFWLGLWEVGYGEFALASVGLVFQRKII